MNFLKTIFSLAFVLAASAAELAAPVASWTFDGAAPGLEAQAGGKIVAPRFADGAALPGVQGQAVAIGVQAGDPEYLTGTAPALGANYTLEAWVWPTQVTGWGRVALNWGTNGRFAYHLALHDGRVNLCHGLSTGKEMVCEGGQVSAECWQQIVAVADRNAADPAKSLLKVYLNGRLVGTKPFDGSCGSGATEPLCLGDSFSYANAGCRYHGYLDSVTFWNRSLSDAEIAARYEPRRAELAKLYQIAPPPIDEIVFVERPSPRELGHWYANIGYHISGPGPAVDRTMEEGIYPVSGPFYHYDGGRLAKLNTKTGIATTLMEDAKGNFRDPCVSYDAKKILFSYRKGGTAQYHLCEINADGTGFRQLTDGIFDDIEPCYLPDGGIVFVSSRAKRWVNCFCSQVATIHRCDGDGRNIRCLSANVEMDNTPWVLPDGRLLYTRWEYVDRNQVQFHHLWAMNPDGSGQTVFFGNLHPWGVFIDAKPIPGTDRILFINSPGHGRAEHAGNLATVTSANGPDDLAAIQSLRPGDSYRDPYPLADGSCLVARGNSLLLVAKGGKRETELFAAQLPLHEPRPLIARPREPVIPTKVDLQKTTGTLILTNAYLGRNTNGIKPGEIKRLVVLEILPKPVNYGGGYHDNAPLSWGGSYTLERLLGTVPVEADGSAHFEVPANRGIVLYAADEHGACLKRMQSFLTVMPGESLSCIGCHENRTMAPLPIANLTAIKRPPSQITPIAGMPDVFDFPRDIQPILDRNCLNCHNPGKLSGGVDLSGDRGILFSNAYINLFYRQQVADGRNGQGNRPPRTLWDIASPLMAKLAGKHHAPAATAADFEIARHWINLGAPYAGTYAALGTGMVKHRYRMIESGLSFPENGPAMAAVQRRCAACHQGAIQPVTSMQLWNPHYPAEFGGADKANALMPHLIYDLTRPEKSRLLMKPLAPAAGGLGMTGKDGKTITIFNDANDPDYQLILAMVKAGQAYLKNDPAWNMPGFKPNADYIREMKRYGILPETFDVRRDPINPYETDRRYWQMFWYAPPGQEPKLYPNPVMHQLLQQDGPKRAWETDFTETLSKPK
jgi:hypothetical protein